MKEDSDSREIITPPETNAKKIKKREKYLQNYRPEWENLPEFKGWLRKSPKGDTFGLCTVCNRDLSAGKSELLKHAAGKKHKKRCSELSSQLEVAVHDLVSVENVSSEDGEAMNVVCYVSEPNYDGADHAYTTQLLSSLCPIPSITAGRRALFVGRSAMEERSAKINSAKGLIAAPFTPFKQDGELNLSVIPRYVQFLAKNNVRGVFVNGTTGEGVSLTVSERKQIAEKWITAGRDILDLIIIQVGSSNIKDCQELARHAEQLGATAIASLPPLYYKPATEDDLIQYLKAIASAAPHLPFLYYHIPSFNGVEVSLSKLLSEGKQQIPTLCGAKYTSADSKELLRSLQLGDFKIFTGFDEILFSGLPMGVTAGIGATYNFMPIPSNNILEAFETGQETLAWEEQLYVRQVVDIIGKHGSIISALKTVMNLFTPIGVGEPRLPLRRLTDDQVHLLKSELEEMNPLKWYKN